MDDAQLKKIQDEIIGAIDEDLKIESTITETAREVAAKIFFSDSVKEVFNNTLYSFKQNRVIVKGKQSIFLVIADVYKYEHAKSIGERYIPFTVTAEIDNKMDLSKNLQAMIEAFFRHTTGKINPEETQ